MRDPWHLTRPFHRPNPSHNDQHVLVEELNALSVQERLQMYDEIHGVAEMPDETPEFVKQKIQEMKHHLSGIAPKSKKAWERAVYLRPSLVTDDPLHLMFLRAKRFDPMQAANLMCVHFENKLELFGEDLLWKRITLQDLTAQEIEMVRTGSLQILKERENRGRAILFASIALYDLQDMKAFCRHIWYVIHEVVQDDEDIQKRGLVWVGNLYGDCKHTQILDFCWRMEHIFKNWPFHVNSWHLCFDNPTLNAFCKALALVSGKDLRMRQRFHHGSIIEVQYALLTFGIDLKDGFIPGQGILSSQFLDQVIQRRVQQEQEIRSQEVSYEQPTSRVALYPNKQDVLMGRFKLARDWPGNLFLNKLIALQAPRYLEASNASRFEKTVIAMEIVQRIEKDSGGRFLDRSETKGVWEVVDEGVAKEKVSQALRTEANRIKKMTAGSASPPLVL